MKNIRKNNVERIKKLFESRTGTPLAEDNTSFVGDSAVLRKPLPILVVIVVTALIVSVAAFAGGMPGKQRRMAWGEKVEFATDENGLSGSGKLYTFDLSFSLDRDAPSEVVGFYVPHLSNEYQLDMGMIYDGLDNGPIGLTSFHFKSLNGEKGITFSQYADLYDDGIRDNKISVYMGITTEGEEPTVTETVYGGMMGYLVSGSMDNETYFVWCDGNYVYELMIYTSTTVLDELVESVKCVENIRPYLVSMTDEDIEASLK
jgi:hypothetical protein